MIIDDCNVYMSQLDKYVWYIYKIKLRTFKSVEEKRIMDFVTRKVIANFEG